jgi:hypothetical protein
MNQIHSSIHLTVPGDTVVPGSIEDIGRQEQLLRLSGLIDLDSRLTVSLTAQLQNTQ